MDDRPLTETRFAEFELSPALAQGLEDMGFSQCTPIQAKTLPLALTGKNVAGQAQTGTGKTAAFLVATFHRLLTQPPGEHRRANQPRALILAPTRELAVQIEREAAQLGRHTGLTLGLAYGGTGYVKQREQLEQGVDILIGTPGRLIDYYKQRVFNLKAVQVAVLDEADRMFDLGFIKDIRYLLKGMPPASKRLNLLFSATLSWRVMELAYEAMDDPKLIQVEPEKITTDTVEQSIYYPGDDEKIRLLIGLLHKKQPARGLIFVNTKRAAETINDYLKANGFQAATLSGDVPQGKRQQLLHDFAQGRIPLLVATDVAARGLDVPGVSHVFNYDLPQDPEDYVHRIGRTARFGAEGEAISFACERYAMSLPDIESYIGMSIPRQPIEEELIPQVTRPQRRSRGKRDGRGRAQGKRSRGRGGKRGSAGSPKERS